MTSAVVRGSFRWTVAVLVLLAGLPAGAATLELVFLDVGQGDAALLKHGAKTILIDTGPSDDIVRVLRRFDVNKLHLLVGVVVPLRPCNVA